MGVVHLTDEQKAKNKDRHREGYFEDYAQKTGRKDRHREGYWSDRAKRERARRKRKRKAYNKKMRAEGYTLETEVRNGKLVKVWVKRETRTIDAVSYHIMLKELQSNLDFESASMECMGDEYFGD